MSDRIVLQWLGSLIVMIGSFKLGVNLGPKLTPVVRDLLEHAGPPVMLALAVLLFVFGRRVRRARGDEP